MKRIFTINMNAGLNLQAVAQTELATKVWTAQEDITVIGVNWITENTSENVNDGFAQFLAELSQTAQMAAPGIIVRAFAYVTTNTAPAYGYAVLTHGSLTFPEGYGIPVKEGGNLYLNISGIGRSAGSDILSFSCEIFYVKGNPKS